MDEKLAELMKNGWSYRTGGGSSNSGGSGNGGGIPVFEVTPVNGLIEIPDDGVHDFLQPNNIFCVISTANGTTGTATIKYKGVNYPVGAKYTDYRSPGTTMILFAKDIFLKNQPLYFYYDQNAGRFTTLNRVAERGIQSTTDEIRTSDSTYTDKDDPITSAAVGDALLLKLDKPKGAAVGQVMEVSEVDENGNPTAWKMVDYSVYHTHGTVKGEIDIFPEQTVSVGVMGTSISLTEDLVIGDEYIVYWDGVPYKCVAAEDENFGIFIGDNTYSYESFPFYIYGEGGHWSVEMDGKGNKTFSIKKPGGEMIQKLDPVYMPEPVKITEKVPGVFAHECMDVWSSTEGSTKRFRITVDDSGTVSATEITG